MNSTGLRAQLFRRKPIASLMADAESHSGGLKRALGALDLTLLGIGAIVGAGIFVLTGVAAAKYAGPAIVLSFVVSGFACAMAALCYAEFAAMIPVAGSAYSYSYATMGELVGWIIGWDLVLEYAVGAADCGVWMVWLPGNPASGLGINLPSAWTHAPLSVPGAIMNLPALLIVIVDHLGALYRHFRERATQLDHRRDKIVRDRGGDRRRRVLREARQLESVCADGLERQ